MSNTASRGFFIAVFIITSILAGFLIACIIQFNKIRNGKQITKGESTTMTLLSGIVLALVLGIWVWSIIYIFFSSSNKNNVVLVKTKEVTETPAKSVVVTTTSTPSPPPPPVPATNQVQQSIFNADL